MLQLGRRPPDRRAILGASVAAVAAAATGSGCGNHRFDAHYKELTDEDKRRIFERIEAETRARTGVDVKISAPQPMDGVEFAYALDLSLCNGNRRCAEACARENNLPDVPKFRYIQVLEMDRGTLDFENANAYYEHDEVPVPGKVYLPVQCQHCANPPCVKVCPVTATWREPDGLVVVDYNWCIGCRYCIAACPYFGRRFNFHEPTVRPRDINPDQGYISNRLRPVGVVEKCTFCLQRTRVGRYPACLEACPTGARKFGNLGDPNGEVRIMLERKRVYVLKEELGTLPRFYYFYG
ncbi:MAG: 4Fe-4S dicluster domain-containing protein [Myxococcales bacterium]|nr:4Fe-4S dicluster domain-containing protein [Myxococcales bacterium]